MQVVAIVEGPGDIKAVPALIGMMGQKIGIGLFAANPIKAGEWPKVRRPGELERLLTLAHSRGGDRILLALDLDDDCPAEEHARACERIAAWKNGRNIDVGVAFFHREFETLFLHQYRKFRENRANLPDLPNAPEIYRGAKAQFKIVTGRRYKETEDQVIITRQLNLSDLLASSRSFQKLVKEVIGMPLDEVARRFQE